MCECVSPGPMTHLRSADSEEDKGQTVSKVRAPETASARRERNVGSRCVREKAIQLPGGRHLPRRTPRQCALRQLCARARARLRSLGEDGPDSTLRGWADVQSWMGACMSGYCCRYVLCVFGPRFMGSLWAGGSIQLAASDPWERLRVDPSLDAYPYAVIYIYIYIYNDDVNQYLII